jgi:hypothetical protein
MPSVRVSTCTRFVLNGHLHLMCRSQGDHISWINGPIAFYHDIALVAMLHVHSHSVKVIAILLEHKPISSILYGSVDR